jgi:hypothetical protein
MGTDRCVQLSVLKVSMKMVVLVLLPPAIQVLLMQEMPAKNICPTGIWPAVHVEPFHVSEKWPVVALWPPSPTATQNLTLMQKTTCR